MKKGKTKETIMTVPFYKLFSFSDSTDVLLMVVGSIGAIGNGLGFPIMTLLFGDLIDTIGRNLANKDSVDVVSKVRSNPKGNNLSILCFYYIYVDCVWFFFV